MATRPIVRATLLASMVVAAAVFLAGCAFSKTIDPVAAAATKTEQAGGADMAMTITFTAAGKSYTITANGAFDQEQGELTMDMSDLLQSAGLPAGAGSGIKLLYVQESGDPVIYMQLPFLASKLPGGKSWIKLDLEQAGKSLGVDLDQLMSQSSQNPAQALDMLRAAGSVEQVGADTVDGVATTEYKATIDLTKAAQLVGVSQDEIQRLTAQGVPNTLPVEVWISDDGLVRKLDLIENRTVGGQSASFDMTVGLSNYGTTVSVTAPPADQVFDATNLAASLAPTH